MQERPLAVGAQSGYAFTGTFRLFAIPFFAICAFAFVFLDLPSHGEVPPKNVLLLYSFTDRKALDSIDFIKARLRSQVRGPVDFQVEYLESQRFATPGFEQGLSEALAATYRDKKFDVVMPASYPALRFAVDHRDRIFPGAPIVFFAVARGRIEGRKLWSGVTGATVQVDVRGTIDLALRLSPDTKNVAVVAGKSEFEQYWLKETDQELRRHPSHVSVVDLVGDVPDELLTRVASLPPHTIVLFQLIPLESTQPVIGTYDLLAAIAQRFPTYCIHNYCLEHGAIGGSYPDSEDQANKVAALAARVLSGEEPDALPVVQGSPPYAVVDWRQLRRWKLSESALPRGSVVLFRPGSVWQQYERVIILAAVLIVLQTLLIVSLLVQRARKQKSEAALNESEQRFHLMADAAPSLIWMCDQHGKVFYHNETRLEFTGSPTDTEPGDGWRANIHPADLQNVLAITARGLETHQGFAREYRLRRHDGVYRWMLDVATPRRNGDGSFAGFIGSASDITDQKLAQDALHKMGGRLIEAQEEERSRIARELHDDICQRLAMISLELEQATRESQDSPLAKARMSEIRQRCADIAGDVQSLSHKLHSSKLEYLGVVAALGPLCREYAQQHHISVKFTHQNVPSPLNKYVSLCLFRVVQEALHNAAKYSGGTQFRVDLWGEEERIHLQVTNDGVGFDVEKAKRNGGLGLLSMHERVHLLKGTLSIDSKLNGGTRITATLPVAAEPAQTAEAETRAATSVGSI